MISVVIPTYNSAKYIKEAIESVLCQTCQDFEIIVTDNDSEDNTLQITKSFSDTRIIVVKNEKNLGMAENWNNGILKSKGEYIKILCSDDVLEYDALEKSKNILDSYKDVVLVSSFRRYIGDRSGLIESPYSGLIDGKEAIKKVIWGYNWIGEPSSVVFRASSLYVGMFNPEWRQNVDLDFWLRLLKTGSLYIIPEPLVSFRSHAEQASSKVLKSESLLLERYDFFMSKYYKNEYYDFEYDVQLQKKRVRILNGLLGHAFNNHLRNKARIRRILDLVLREKLFFLFLRNYGKAIMYSILKKKTG
ncbi:MAG: glycosyltransferase [Bacteroidales bacterium]|nr:glycosyltransferase [Bacteroidales bacterium]